MIFLIFIIFLILVILSVSLITYFNSKNETNNIITEKSVFISEIFVPNNFTRYIDIDGEGFINWGDGTSESFNSKSKSLILSHNYTLVGDYTLKIEGDITSIIYKTIQSDGENVPNIIQYNLEIINPKNLETLSLNFLGKDDGNEKYFLKGLEICEALSNLNIIKAQNDIILPNYDKLINLNLNNPGNNYITGINNLYNQTKLQSLSFFNIPTDLYKNGSGEFDISNSFSSLKSLTLLALDTSLDNLILNDNLNYLYLQNLNVTNIDNLNYDNYSTFVIKNVNYFNNISSLSFSGNTVLQQLGYEINNSGSIYINLPVNKTTLTDLMFSPLNSGNNTISFINAYTNITSLALNNFDNDNILIINNLSNLEYLTVNNSNLSILTLSSDISKLSNVDISNNSINIAQLNAIGQNLLNQGINNGFLNVSNNPDTFLVFLNILPWSSLINDYNWNVVTT